MIIDGHAHLGGEYKDLPSIVSTLDKSGADKVVLCPADTARPRSMPLPVLAEKIPDIDFSFSVNRLLRATTARRKTDQYIETGNEEVFKIAGLSDGRVIQFFWADMRRNDLIDDLDSKLNLWNFKGIKLHQCVHPFKINSSSFNDLARYAAARNLPLFIHLHSRNEIIDFISVAQNHKTIFITGHLIGLDIFVAHKQSVGDNIYFDISCPQLVSTGLIKHALKEFGPRRLIMGSDTPYGRNNISLIISRIRSLDLPDTENEMILGNNLKNILML
jgi:predicted TIM-barrel fold metal-dependent hydrolase